MNTIVTTTFYKSSEETRFKLACRMLEAAARAGHTTVVVDGSPEDVRSKLQERASHLYPELHSGMGPSRRQAFFHAYEVARSQSCDTILWTEAEKVGIIEEIPKINEELWRDPVPGYANPAIVIPSRSEKSWRTWPSFQAKSEREANDAYAECVGIKADVMFGPVAFKPSVAKYFITFDPVQYDGEVPDTYIQHFAPIWALADGKRISTVEVEMEYPKEQRAEEEGVLNEAMLRKRHEQKNTLIRAYRKMRIK